MSRLTQKPAVGVLNPWNQVSSNPNLSSTLTATPATTAQAYAAIPATGAKPGTGTGIFDPEFVSYVGEKFETSDGREFVLVQNGAVALTTGKLVQCPAEVTAFEKLAMTVPTTYPATAGLTQIYVTNGATVLNVNQFQDGYAVVAAGTGIGQQFKIASHQPAANGAKFVVNLEDPIQVTLDATSKISLVANPYKGVVVQVASGTTQTGAPVGITVTALAASTAATYDATYGTLTTNGVAQYGLIQTHGPVVATITTTTNVGYALGISTTAGSLIATPSNYPTIAYSLQTQTDGQCGLVYLTL